MVNCREVSDHPRQESRTPLLAQTTPDYARQPPYTPSNDALSSGGDGGTCPSASPRDAARRSPKPFGFAQGRLREGDPRTRVLQDPTLAIQTLARISADSV